MMELTPHFTLEEATFSERASRKGINNQPSEQIFLNIKQAAVALERVRFLLGQPITINSWYRNAVVNKLVGGSKGSSHMGGWAIDFRCENYGRPLKIAQAIANSTINFDQLIHEYDSWVHISFDPRMRMQLLTYDSKTVTPRKGLLEARR
jgi:hypothetical protein